MMLNFKDDFVKIIEVGARDGLQNESKTLDTDIKLEYIKKLVASGLKTIEVTSFVKPTSIPQMYDSSELFSKVWSQFSKNEALSFPCLVPNTKGLESAVAVGVKEIALFSATSDDFTKKNINMTVNESFIQMKEVSSKALSLNMKVRGYISTAFGCPYDGHQSTSKLVDLVQRFLDLGVYEVSIGDTIGVATPLMVRDALDEILKVVDKEKIAMHFHDTRGMALSNVLISLEKGIRSFDSSSGGLGGCPYANGATGNLATEDLLYLLNSLGLKTAVNMDKLIEASSFILNQVNKSSPSKYYQAYKK